MLERELAFANELAGAADAESMRRFRALDLDVRVKADLSLVTESDLAVEALLRERIAASFPDDAILGEEEGGPHDAHGRAWVLDPIDATYNFARGIQIWATLIALQLDGEPVLGVVSAPALGERYAARRGGGATLNGERIRVSEVATIGEAHLLHAGVKTFLREPGWDGMLATWAEARRTRAFGDFWGHALVARGAAEAMIEPELSVWDFAAIHVIVEEAGGRMTTVDGRPVRHGGTVLTSNGRLHDELVRRLGADED